MSQAPDFDRLAGVYRWMEIFSFGPLLQRCRCAFLGDMDGRQRALILGDGDGRFTARLLNANPTVQVDVIDISSAMLKALTQRTRSSRIRAYRADARVWQPEGIDQQYDLIVTHFFLDCLTTDEVRRLASALRGSVSPSVMWVVSEFAVPEKGFGRFTAPLIVSALYWAFGWLTGLTVRRLPDHRSALRQAGFALLKQRQFLGGVLVSEVWITNPLV